jgi:(1->4)-alpha-D-glucan 1-alpha-D-glucosylmutase
MGYDTATAPLSTYRLQLNADFTFAQVCERIAYFRDMGITHLYLSPCLAAAAGSRHGYDVVDPTRVNPELGGAEGFERLTAALAEHGMGLVLDIVPNHMAAAGRQNPWWWDVLANGRSSRYAGFFDIRWDHPDPGLRGKVLLPILGEELECCLAARQVQIRKRGGEVIVAYFEHEMPASRASLEGLMPVAVGAPGAAAAGELDALNADPSRLRWFLDRQHYRLAFWRRANRELNYRRFFDIHQLAGVCVEKEEVFAATHGLVLRWVAEGRVDGLRVDHPDGLRDPEGYLRRLRAAAPRAWVVVEKILEPGETLRREWPVAGTTGYDFLNVLGGLFIDPRGERPLTELYRQFTGEPADCGEIVRAAKRQVLERLFVGEVTQLTELLERLVDAPNIRADELRRALTEVIACFPVYRTYIRPEAGNVAAEDQAVLREALAEAAGSQGDVNPGVWRMIEDLLLLRRTGDGPADFVLRFQQLTGPAMAKGVEDTVFYRFNRLVALNEVGGDPAGFGTSLEAFHAFCRRLQAQWPQTQLASATHDTKRGEDTRLRIGLLSEMPGRWAEAVRRWARMNAVFRTNGLPDANCEYFLYQTMVGTWPIGADRLAAYMLKAAKEAKARTSWTDPDAGYENALRGFVEGVLGHTEFIADLEAFLQPMLRPAAMSSLAQTLIKCTAPGVPDIYQGTEVNDLSLVDPDNRRPVDFDLRRRLAAEVDRLSAGEVLEHRVEGLPKLFVLKRTLAVRRRVPEAFGPQADYRPLASEGGRAGHLVGFERGGRALTLAPRRLWALAGRWGDTVVDLPAGEWLNVFTKERWSGGRRETARLLAQFPVALLLREGGRP